MYRSAILDRVSFLCTVWTVPVVEEEPIMKMDDRIMPKSWIFKLLITIYVGEFI